MRIFVFIVAIAIIAFFANVAESEEKPLHTDKKVVLELFTSQGCSSCPPADELLSRLANDPEWKDKIIPLAFHVDYWNYLGWKDPFSRPEWTERQGDYAQAQSDVTMYTPQLVVQGRQVMVGSKEKQVKSSILRHWQDTSAHQLELEMVSLKKDGLNWEGQVRVKGQPAGAHTVFAAVFQKGLQTAIPRGENAGRKLVNDFVVRSLVEIGRLSTREGDIYQLIDFEIHLDSALNPDELGLAIFAQHQETLHINGAFTQSTLD